MIYYTIYKVTNKVNGKIYIGSHKTKDLNDSYMGSGKYLNYAFKKHGIENFTKKILYVFDTPELMYAKEAELVNEDFIAESNTYNLKIGGFGGFDYLNSDKFDNPTHSPEHLKNMNKKMLTLYPNGPFYGKKRSSSSKEKAVSTRRARYGAGAYGTFSGKHHTEDAKKKIGAATSNAQRGEGNSQYGTMWVYSTDLKMSKKIKKTDIIPDGWIKGRKIKF
jgi:group I intron endonuclease